MDTPIQVVFHGRFASPKVIEACEREVARIERHVGRITSCRVVVDAPRHRPDHGELHAVRLHVNLAGANVTVDRMPPEHAEKEAFGRALRQAFDAAQRQLMEIVRRRRASVRMRRARESERPLRG